MRRLSRSCDHLLWASTGEAETGKSGAAEAAAAWTLRKMGTGEVAGVSCKALRAENTESLPALEGLSLPRVRAASCQKFQRGKTRCSCSAFRLPYPGVALPYISLQNMPFLALFQASKWGFFLCFGYFFHFLKNYFSSSFFCSHCIT